MLFAPDIELGKATKAKVQNCRYLTDRFTTQIKIRGFYFRDKNQLDTILNMFIPNKDFWEKPYHKNSKVTFAWPNVNENMWLEFGKLVRGVWTPCIPDEATHVGLYFWDYGFSYLVNHDDEVLNIERKEGKRYYYFVVKKLPFKVDVVDVYDYRYDG